jgi:hypothetical protein
MKRKKMDQVLFKIDFKKDYDDKVKRRFLLQVMRMKGFHPKWYDWIEDFVQGVCVGIMVNKDFSHYFLTKMC